MSRCALREDSETNDDRELHIGSDSTSSGKNLIHLEINSLFFYTVVGLARRSPFAATFPAPLIVEGRIGKDTELALNKGLWRDTNRNQ